jgi:hypothetical protein
MHIQPLISTDQAILPEPISNVDYLSNEWNEEDIWMSWSYVHRRGTLANHVRLENALWRSWMKTKNHLKTMPPQALNWFKDNDVTWLYGPRQTEGKKVQFMSTTSPPPSYPSDSAPSIPKKSILKKNLSFVCPDLPTPPECKHVQFEKEVRQTQGADSEDDDGEDECALTMSPSPQFRCGYNRATLHASFSSEAKTIAPLPSTALKYRIDTPGLLETGYDQTSHSTGEQSCSRSSPQAVSRPLGSSNNFLIDDNFDEVDEPRQRENNSNDKQTSYVERDSEYPVPRTGWTESSIFKQYIEDKEEDTMNNTLFGQAVCAVNTFRDVSYVVLTAGWNRT